ncbi:hypothetical protein BSK66_06800 [Paenibacillus odorifer]|uniref:Uncharacterized protein n=1 Tax=Paenibacillus odorifer TaxID=189426 RepID=A0A1R0WUF6_9BACL|nr:hypothetical protein C171_06052 [Paenibacillus sp. FSL H8-237]OMD21445.1 hypothetical protein BJP51_07400 [Paenibacillus odorifer]OME62072.1 hypothetical protein BSK66_06800 [Paenibacillus odorifer]
MLMDQTQEHWSFGILLLDNILFADGSDSGDVILFICGFVAVYRTQLQLFTQNHTTYPQMLANKCYTVRYLGKMSLKAK